MGNKKKNKGPSSKVKPNEREVRTGINPENFDKQTPAWALSSVDLDGKWGCNSIDPDIWWKKIFPKLQNFETMTWAEIKQPCGGRTHGTNNHPVPVEKLCREARQRLDEIGQGDIDELFSLRLEAKQRIYGIKEGRVLKIIWFDSDHEIYPSGKK